MAINRKQIIALIAVFTERYVLSLVYLYFATTHFRGFVGLLSGRISSENTLFIDATHKLTLFLLAAFSCLLLLLARRAAVPPQKLKLVLVPLAASFFNFLYYVESMFPASWQINLSPPAWQMPLLSAGLVCIIVGPAIAFWGMLHLGRSFGVFVTVRTVVLTGPYKWIRHPMYLGWIFMNIGLVLANFSGFYFLLFALNLPLILYRAGLEQAQLSDHSAEYREYMKHTRFIFPRLCNPFSRLRKAE